MSHTLIRTNYIQWRYDLIGEFTFKSALSISQSFCYFISQKIFLNLRGYCPINNLLFLHLKQKELLITIILQVFLIPYLIYFPSIFPSLFTSQFSLEVSGAALLFTCFIEFLHCIFSMLVTKYQTAQINLPCFHLLFQIINVPEIF